MRRILTFLALLPLLPLLAAVDPTDVPTFTIRCRLVEVDGQPTPADRRTTFYLSGNRAGISATGAEWSNELAFDIEGVTAALKLYPNLYLKRYPVVLHLRTRPATKDMKVEAEIRWQAAKAPAAPGQDAPDTGPGLDERPADLTLGGHLFGERLGMLLWREDGKPRIATMTQYNQRFWDAFADTAIAPADRPKHFPIVDRFIGGDSDRDDWREGIVNLSHAGFSALMVPAGKELREVLLSTGLRRTAGAVYNPPGYAFDHDPKIDQAAIDAWAHKQADPFLNSGYSGADMALYGISDEPGWYFPVMFKSITDHPLILERFHKYLADQGLKPADVGAASWDTVMPIGRSQADTLEHRRLFYWTTRFYPWDSARHFARSTKALEQAFGAPVPIFVNWNFFSGRFWFPGPFGNNPDKTSPDSAMGCHDWFEFARLRGCNMLWTEDWFGDDRAWQWSFYGSKLGSAARLSDIQWGGYVIPRTAGQRQGGIVQKIMTIVGSGGKGLKYFVFGPEYNFPGNCYSPRSVLLNQMAEAHQMIGKAEDVLWPGKRPPSSVAILQPRSSMPWDPYDPKAAIYDATNTGPDRHTSGYMAEVFGLYTALQHANVPTDWIDEDALTAEGLAPLKVLYITEPCVPAEAVPALLAWVEQGGTLVATSAALTRDRYHEPTDAFWSKLGLDVKPRDVLLVPAARKLPTVAETASYAAVGVADDPAAGVQLKALGKGRVAYFGWLPGASYWASQGEPVGGLPGHLNEIIRTLLTTPIVQAGARPPVAVSLPQVETPLLLSDAGAAVTLLNWRGAPADTLDLTVALPFKPATAEAVKAGKLTMHTLKDGRVAVSLPLDLVDVVSFKP